MQVQTAAWLSSTEVLDVVHQFGLFFDRFGFRRNVGRLWALLYLSPEPLSQADLGEALGLSAGLVSAGLKELGAFGAIEEVPATGGRRTLYRCPSNLLGIVATILRRRELESVAALRKAVRSLLALPGRPAPVGRRLRAVEEVCDLYEALGRWVGRLAELPSGALPAALSAMRAVQPQPRSEDSA